MAYSYGYGGPAGGRYGGGYGDVQEFNRNRHAPYGGDGAYGVYSGDRDYGYGGVVGGGRGGAYRTETVDTYTTTPRYSYGADRSYGGVGVYGGGYGSGVRDYERENRSTRKIRYGGAQQQQASYGSKSRSYRDTDRNFSKYRNKQRDSSTSSSSSSDDDNREGFLQRAADKVKGVFGYGPDAQNDNQYGPNSNNYSSGAGYNTSSRKNKYYDNNQRTSSYYGNNNNTQQYGSYGGSYGASGSYGGGNEIVSLKSRREVRPAYQEESGNKSLLWQVNVRGFDLDDIKVSDAGNNKIEISGHSEDVGAHHRRTKQFTRIVTLPEGSNAKEVKSRISGNGLLTITVPYTGTGKGLGNNYTGTRELQLGQGSTHQSAITGRSGATGTTGSYGSSNTTTGSGGAQYQSHTTTSATRTSTNNQ